jgi:TPR repeat protein
VAYSSPGDPRSLLDQGRALESSGNIKGAVRLYTRAVRAGEFEAAKRLGDIFREGKGDVPGDHRESLRYYAIAERNGIKIEREQGK